MSTFGWAKVAVYYAKNDPYAIAYREVFDHAGLRVDQVPEINGAEINRFQVLVLCGNGKLSNPEVISVQEWLKKGHTLICSGSAWGLEAILGLSTGGVHISNGIITPINKSDKIWPEAAENARFFGGTSMQSAGCDILATIGDAVGIGKRKNNKSLAIYLAPHVGQTLQLMQYGRSVECDGIGPSDGSARLDDGVLRAEDGTALDFEKDRTLIEGCDTPFFGTPHSDIIREILIRAITTSVDQRGLSIPIFWHWPHNSRSAAVLTVDCDEFEREHVNQYHRMLAMFGTPAGWMVGLPGYSLDVYRAMRAWEHEVGLLYVSEEQGTWHEEKFKIQFTAVSRLTAQPNLMSSRAMDGRWRGWKAFYDICEVGGARVSLSKGGRQPGTSGFLFGTSHPFVPMHRDGSPYLVTEIPYTIYEPGTGTPDPVAEKIAYQTASRYGCLQIVCKSNSIESPEFTASLRRILSICKQQRMVFMIPENVHKFERGRRQLRVMQKLLENEGTLLLTSDAPLAGLTVLVNGPHLTAEMRGKEVNVEMVERYGCRFNAIQFNIEAKQQVDIRIWPQPMSAAA